MEDFEDIRQIFHLAIFISEKLKPARATGGPLLAASLHRQFGGELAQLTHRLDLISEIPTTLPTAAAAELSKIARIVKEAFSHTTLPDGCMIFANSDLGLAGMHGLDALTAERNKHLYPWADRGPSEENVVDAAAHHRPTPGRMEASDLLQDELWEALDNCIARMRESPIKVLFEMVSDSPESLDVARINRLATEAGLCAERSIFVERKSILPGADSETDRYLDVFHPIRKEPIRWHVWSSSVTSDKNLPGSGLKSKVDRTAAFVEAWRNRRAEQLRSSAPTAADPKGPALDLAPLVPSTHLGPHSTGHLRPTISRRRFEQRCSSRPKPGWPQPARTLPSFAIMSPTSAACCGR